MFIPIQSEAPKFQCNACGSCCSHMRGIIPKEDRDFIREYAFGKMPVVQLVPAELMTFPLWDWEAKRFREWQKEAGVDARIKPLRAVFDLKSNKAIILTYFMDSGDDACPLLKENKCSIYNTKRAYVCRMFPFNRGPFIKGGMDFKEGLFGECRAMEKMLPQLPSGFNDMMRLLDGAFPDGSFLNAVQNDLVVEWANSTIIELARKRIIKPAMNYPYEFLLKRISNAEKIDFTDFLVWSNHFTEEEKESLIKKFDGNEGAKEKISSFLGVSQ